MDDSFLLSRLGLALGLGLLVGLQRQRAESRLAGIRTFPLITLFGTLSAVLAQNLGGVVIAGALLALTALSVAANLLQRRQTEGPIDPGITTESAMLLMFGVGAYLLVGEPLIAVVVAAGVAVLLQLKQPLHRAVASLGDHDFKAITQFVLISLVILPLLPDRDFGPYGVLNLRQIWWMVVLIVGIGLCGYLIYKYVGQKAGTVAGGLIGGLVSSTATAVGWAQRSRDAPGLVPIAAVVILLSSAVMFARVLLEVGVVAPAVFAVVAWPIGAMLVAMVLLAIVEMRRAVGENPGDRLELSNPSELRPAFVFALIYSAVLLAVAAVQDWIGPRGLYWVALLSGMTDMDAITLSTARLMQDGQLETAIGWRVIVTASLSNLLFKLGAVALSAPAVLATGEAEGKAKAGVLPSLASHPLLRRVALRFSMVICLGIGLIFFWPT